MSTDENEQVFGGSRDVHELRPDHVCAGARPKTLSRSQMKALLFSPEPQRERDAALDEYRRGNP